MKSSTFAWENTKEPPSVPKDLLALVLHAFPPGRFDPSHSIEKIMYEEGKQVVVNWLKHLHERQTNGTKATGGSPSTDTGGDSAEVGIPAGG